MEKHKYLEYQYKIDYFVLERIWGTSVDRLVDYDTLSAYGEFRNKVSLEHYLMFDEDGRMDNPDGCYYFNDVEELVFQEAREEEKTLMRTKIKENMVSRDTVL
ncbi:hypothetical protein R7892_05625 [Ligilactobacillus murinus]|uniref:hypothetical protein n=1 Tax=Ligilactobacillus murinus TaxID=1622 RepID=UPI00296AF890|nr:hypothetical protein [Ligilactobacillus murinus]WOY88176.1 hypothetical protein R7892_05625 [Ligilactobacillus murinus]